MLKFAVKRKASDIFHEAVLTKDLARVKFLLMNNNEQFNVDELDSDGLTALQRSCFTGNTKLVQLLVTYGANLLIQDKEGWTLLHAAAVAGNNTILRYLVAMGADVCVRNDQGDMAIDLAADIETVIILAEAMQRVGMVAEIASFLAKKPEMKESLKEKLIEAKRQNLACQGRSRAVSAPVGLFTGMESYATHVISEDSENTFPWAEFLMSEGSGRFVNRDASSTLERLSAMSFNRRPVSDQLGNPLEIHNHCVKVSHTETGKALCVKCERRNKEKHKRLSIASDASLSSDSSSSSDSAYSSIYSISLPTPTNLDNFAFSDSFTPDEMTVTERARSKSVVIGQYPPVLHGVCSSRAPHHSNARRVSSSPSKLLHQKVNTTNGIDSRLAEFDAENIAGNIENLNELNGNGMSLLHEASAQGDSRKVAFLLNSGAEVNRQSLYGSTPLHEAAMSGNLTCSLMLIDAGADIFAETDSGLLPVDQARSRDMRQLIQRAMTIR